jgi:hypothetical protein
MKGIPIHAGKQLVRAISRLTNHGIDIIELPYHAIIENDTVDGLATIAILCEVTTDENSFIFAINVIPNMQNVAVFVTKTPRLTPAIYPHIRAGDTMKEQFIESTAIGIGIGDNNTALPGRMNVGVVTRIAIVNPPLALERIIPFSAM